MLLGYFSIKFPISSLLQILCSSFKTPLPQTLDSTVPCSLSDLIFFSEKIKASLVYHQSSILHRFMLSAILPIVLEFSLFTEQRSGESLDLPFPSQIPCYILIIIISLSLGFAIFLSSRFSSSELKDSHIFFKNIC